jgi:hypothetical protein
MKKRSVKYNLKAMEIDHIVPLSAGGSDRPDNIALVDRETNSRMGVFVTHLEIKGIRPLTKEDIVFYRLSQDTLGHFGVGQEKKANEPPAAPEWIVSCLVPKKTRDAILGDMKERFHDNLDQGSSARAKRLYWADAVRSVAPLVWRAIKRVGTLAMMWKYFSGR